MIYFKDEMGLGIEEFKDICNEKAAKGEYPLSDVIDKGVPLYDGKRLAGKLDGAGYSLGLKNEWHRCLLDGPGVLVIKNFYDDCSVVDEANTVFEAIIADEKENEYDKGDHFGFAKYNERIWNSFQKHAVRAPDNFVDYYSNPLMACISEAWLGPGYQITSQVNVVKPGGKAQLVHCDYHLGFMSEAQVSRYPISMQKASRLLTLQGAVAQVDMPIQSGATQFLPYSQRYLHGYRAYRSVEFQEFFRNNCVQLPLKKGDAVFFSPALFHAAGENSTEDKNRIANLLQISSAFGRATEAVSTEEIMRSCYPILLSKYGGGCKGVNFEACLNAVAEVYPFPTNLDLNPPKKDMAPVSQRDLLYLSLQERWPIEKFEEKLEKLGCDRMP